jgi:hypothetical protein
VADVFSFADLENLARRHDPDLDAEILLEHLAGVSGFDDERFAAYGLDDHSTTDLRTWTNAWYDDLARRIIAERLTDELSEE